MFGVAAAMSGSRSEKGMSVVTLGISAIDLLCCAMVSGLVMFLVLSSPDTAKTAGGMAPGEVTGIKVFYRPETDGVVLVLQFVNVADKSKHSEFFSDIARNNHLITEKEKLDPLVEPTGSIFEHKDPAGNGYLYIIRKLHPVEWDIRLLYANTDREFGSSVPRQVTVSVNLEGACPVQLSCVVGIGENLSMINGCMQKSSSSTCNVATIFNELVRKRSGQKPP